ncbi:MAG: radical SAM protein [Clostridia bacterium]
MEQNNLIRYSVITEKNPREILLLRGSGCKWRRCTFCDYHLDFSRDTERNYQCNIGEIQKVTGQFQKLEVINSGSFCDLDEKTMDALLTQCRKTGIKEIHFECHWMHRKDIPALRDFFGRHNITVKIKIGVETFDADFRETVLKKGIDETDSSVLAGNFDEVCLLFGLTGQTEASMKKDIETGLRCFERVCVNIMVENSTKIKPDPAVIAVFAEKIAPLYLNDRRVDILMENTDFGVGSEVSR